MFYGTRVYPVFALTRIFSKLTRIFNLQYSKLYFHKKLFHFSWNL